MSALSRLIERRNVDLPHPDGPMSAVTARDGIVIVTSKSACLGPYQKLNSRAVIVPVCGGDWELETRDWGLRTGGWGTAARRAPRVSAESLVPSPDVPAVSVIQTSR